MFGLTLPSLSELPGMAAGVLNDPGAVGDAEPQPRITNSPRLDVDFSGCEREFGEAIGEVLREKIRGALAMVSQLESFQMHRPWWIPEMAFESLARRYAASTLRPTLDRCWPHFVERIAGMAAGAKVSEESLLLFHALESMQNPLDQNAVTPALAGCSAVAIGPRQSETGEPLMGHNFDMLPVSQNFLAIRRRGGGDRLRSLQFSYAPLAGVIDGINEAGLAISYNFVGVTDGSNQNPPISMAIDESLSRCVNVDEAITFLRGVPRAGGALLMLADDSGEIVSLQMSATRHHAIRPSRSSPQVLWHTNDFTSRRMLEVEVPRGSTFGRRCPESLRGREVYQSPQRRRRALRNRLAVKRQWSSDDLSRLMTMHEAGGEGSDDSVCMHGAYWSTIASLQLHPRQRAMRVAYGPACRAESVWLTLS